MSELEALEAKDPSTDPARLTELAASNDDQVRDAALCNPTCPPEAREASGLVFVMALEKFLYYDTIIYFDFTVNEVLQELWVAGLIDLEDAYGFLECTQTDTFIGPQVTFEDDLVWIGSDVPDWWNSWSVIDNFLGSQAVIDALKSGDCFAPWAPPNPEEIERFEGSAKRVQERQAVTGLEAMLDPQTSSERLMELSEFWLNNARQGAKNEDSQLTLLALAGLARNPNSPESLLERLAYYDNLVVRSLVTRNPGASDETRAAAVLTGVNAELLEELSSRDEDDDWSDCEGEEMNPLYSEFRIGSELLSVQDFRDKYAPAGGEIEEVGLLDSSGRPTYDSRTQSIDHWFVREMHLPYAARYFTELEA